MQTTIDETDCRKFYRLLAHQTSTEIRLIDPTRVKPPISKFVRSETEFLAELKNPVNYGGVPRQVYCGLNGRKPGGRNKAGVVSLDAILIDIDRNKNAKALSACASDQQIAQAIEHGKRIASDLFDEFGIRVALAMSGNGVHLLLNVPAIPISNENRDMVGSMVKSFGAEMARRYDANLQKAGFELDTAVFDLARITKTIGTMSVKGDNHRMTYFVDGPYPPSHADQLFANYLMSLPVEDTKASRTKSRKTTPTSIPEIPQATSDHVEHLLEKCAFIKQFETKPLENYDKWIGIGGNLRLLGDAGLSLWDKLSSGASNYSQPDLVDKWEHGDLYAYGCHRLGCTQRCGVGMPINHVYERFGTGGDTNDLLKVTVPLRTIRDDLEHHIKKILNGA